MIAHVVTTRFAMTPDRRLWSANGILSYRFWTRYLNTYDGVRLICQADRVEQPPEDWHEVTGEGVAAAPLSTVGSPKELLHNGSGVFCALRKYLKRPGAVHLRGPSVLCDLAWFAMPKRRPYGIEIVGDPYDSFAPGAFKSVLRPIYRSWFSSSLKKECLKATAAAYVTEEVLQRRYPPGRATYSTYFSSIEMGDEAFVPEPKRFEQPPTPVTIVHVGTMNQLYKAPHIMIDAAANAVKQGGDIRLIMVGDGQYRPQLEQQATDCLYDRAEFTGRVSAGQGVREVLDRADLFVLPSFQEGMPKAIIEAMARGLPCIGSDVGGIPEILHEEDMVSAGDVSELACKLLEVTQDADRLNAMSERNLRRARDFHIDRIRERRNAFYEVVKDESLKKDWDEGPEL